MLPIYFSDGLERYLLAHRDTAFISGVELVGPTRAQRVLEAALRRRDAQLIRQLAAVLHIHGHDLEQVANRLLARLSATGRVSGDLVLYRDLPGEIVRLDPRGRVDPLPPMPPPPEPIIDDEDPDDDPPEAKTTIRVSLYFDGTANNRANAAAHHAQSRNWRRHKRQTSFKNDFSNVSRLETLYRDDPEFEHSYAIYVEGIGTTDGRRDSKIGMATGMGGTGIKAKVEKGVDELLRTLRERGIPRGEIIERFHVDAFGFSRGAAAARYFVHYVREEDPLQAKIEARGYPVEQFEVNFIGLFDTVASHGLDHDNDTRDLSLDAIRAAKKVVQLAAAEEHRKNFRLTDIRSAIDAGVGVEIFLPGVHSDIGGGYLDDYDEEDLQILDFDGRRNRAMRERFARERAWLIESGWYRESEIADVNFWNELKVTKRGISNHYDRIPLKHMAEFASETGLRFEDPGEQHPILGPLTAVRDIVADHVAATVGGTRSTPAHWINMRGETFKRLRHDYLHFSAYYGTFLGVNEPDWSSGGQMNGRRRRTVNAG